MLQTSYVDENHHFLTYLAKNPAKITCFYEFFNETKRKSNGTHFGING